LRFKNSFSFDLKIAPGIDLNDIEIPAMLIQPYIENAIWHGLMSIGGRRKGQITLDFSRKENLLRIIIEDNGIGRQRSFELKERQSKTKRHESKGLSISSDRLDVLTRQGYHAQLNITDKINETGEPAGTLVSIELSTFLKI